jgi:hypothetical protein
VAVDTEEHSVFLCILNDPCREIGCRLSGVEIPDKLKAYEEAHATHVPDGTE